MEWVDVRAEIPWLGPPPFWLSHFDGYELRSALARLGFVVFEAGAEATETEEEFRRALAEAMDLADYAWKNWDAFQISFWQRWLSSTYLNAWMTGR